MRERLVLRSLLPDDHHFGGAVQPPSEEHRAVLPAKGLPAQNGPAQAAIVRRFGEQLRPSAHA